MDILSVNEIIRDDLNDKEYRVLWIDEGNVIAFLIDVNAKSPSPFSMAIKEILNLINDQQMIKVKDHPMELNTLKYEISHKDLLIRDDAWNSIKDIVIKQPDIYIKDKRGNLIHQAVTKSGETYKTILSRLRKYWIRGMTINCLIPDYDNCGVKNRTYENKPGKKRKDGIEGIIVTDKIKQIFDDSLKKYYLTNDSNTLIFAYKEMLRHEFNKAVYFKDGVKQIILKPESELPTFNQFKFYFKSNYQTDKILKERLGETTYERNFRPNLGNSTYETSGPGSVYQIDSTSANIFIVNRVNRNWTIGRPIIYFVTDVFSRLITGLYIGLENDSYVSAMMGIENSLTDKVDYCAKYGVNISSEFWPAQGLPGKIVCDRGPLEGYSVNNLVDGLSIDVELNPAYRPDWKGIVEQLMKKSQDTIRPFLPGYVDKDYGERGAKDPRLKATLNLDEYIKIMIQFINYYNHNYYIKEYVRDLDMIEDGVKPIPIELWNWGIKNRSGKLRHKAKKVIEFHLLPQDNATVTNKGIRYKKMLYSCKEGIEQGWFTRQTSWKIKISYDPRCLNQIYIHTDEKDVFITCSLLNHQERYINLSIEEIDQLLSEEVDLYNEIKHEILQNEVNLFESIEHIVKEASSDKNNQFDDSISDNQRKKNYRERKNEEKDYRRQFEAFQPDKEDTSSPPSQNQVIEIFEDKGKSGSRDKIRDLFNENWVK